MFVTNLLFNAEYIFRVRGARVLHCLVDACAYSRTKRSRQPYCTAPTTPDVWQGELIRVRYFNYRLSVESARIFEIKISSRYNLCFTQYTLKS